MEEQYKIIKDYKNYGISNFGKVRNIKTQRILKFGVNNKGYRHIILCKDKCHKTFTIHRLLAEAFIPNPENKKCVDYINNIRFDNRLENIRWCTYPENCQNSKLSKRNSTGVKGVKFNSKINKYRAEIRHSGKYYHLGYFDNLEDAKAVRQAKATELFGDYLNDCEKVITINLNIKTNKKVIINLNIEQDEQDLEQLEKEFLEIMNKK